MYAKLHLQLMPLLVMYKGIMQPVLLPVPQVRRWQLPMFLPMLSLLLFTLPPLSEMLPTLPMPISPQPKNVIGNINAYSD
jgi:hypothetical protein